MKLRLITAATLVVVLVGTAATFALARTHADATVRACVAVSNGDVRIPAPSEACKKGETPTTWNVTGPQGPQGDTGPQGAAGPAGKDGAAAPSPNAIQGSFTATGAKQGPITGDGPGGTIVLAEASHAIVSPRDAASGLPTGKRQHKPFTISKQLDRSTPLLMKALVNNENLSAVTFSFRRGGSATPYMTVKLTDANVSSNQLTGEIEIVQFTYRKIEWTWVDGGVTAQDDWEAPVV